MESMWRVVTASGNTLENGAANYYVIHKEPTDLNENVPWRSWNVDYQVRCHNHPLEKWTQKQYYEMANLFSRVGLKNGSAATMCRSFESPGEINLDSVPPPPRPLDGEAPS
jgi:hypothetical protein